MEDVESVATKQDQQEQFVRLVSTVLFTDSSNHHAAAAAAASNNNSKDTTTTTTHHNQSSTEKKETKTKQQQETDNKTTPSSSPIQDDLERYQSLLQQQDQHLDKIKKTRKRIRTQQAELWNVYQYGLQQIGNLQDLSQAPDAILPGNFCQ
jgi:hypothetical protein